MQGHGAEQVLARCCQRGRFRFPLWHCCHLRRLFFLSRLALSRLVSSKHRLSAHATLLVYSCHVPACQHCLFALSWIGVCAVKRITACSGPIVIPISFPMLSVGVSTLALRITTRCKCCRNTQAPVTTTGMAACNSFTPQTFKKTSCATCFLHVDSHSTGARNATATAGAAVHVRQGGWSSLLERKWIKCMQCTRLRLLVVCGSLSSDSFVRESENRGQEGQGARAEASLVVMPGLFMLIPPTHAARIH